MKSYLNTFFSFLRTGKIKTADNERNLIINTILFVIIMYILAGILAIIIGITTKGLNITNQTSNTLAERSTAMMFLFPVIIGPILEEIGFRLSLKFSRINMSLTSSVLTYFILSDILDVNYYFTTNYLLIRISASILTGVFIYFLFVNKKIQVLIKNFWNANSKLILYLFAFVFAFWHITNFGSVKDLYFLMPILTIPQLIYAFTFSFIRLRIGVFYSIIVHSLFNLIPFIIRVL